MKLSKYLKLVFSFVFLMFLVSCDDSDTTKTNAEAPTISIRLVDAPGDFEAVNVEVVDVMIKMDDNSDDDNGWMSLEAESGIVDLLDFTGGISKVLVDRFPIPEGKLTQMRLVLGDGNTIVIKDENDEDETFDLKTPSGQQSGLKLKVNTEIQEGFVYDFVLDFDVEKSIVIAGNSGNIILKPVLYVSAEVNSGIIEGTVSPSDVPVMASVLVDDMGTPETDDDFVISAYTDDTGKFALWGVPPGTYDVVIMPTDDDSDYADTVVEGVTVTKGEVTIIDETIALSLKPASLVGSVSGLATDVIATVAINDTNSTSVNTDATGEYSIENIVPGDYKVTFSATGYVTQEIDVTLEPGEAKELDATLIVE
ncbi:Carboxypeptidase regulatory-like domain-containing protein [Hyunsoonleella jejuensis]|uniref:Carboxypeptidase regulatory-like domain-containing protein n=1 Tax=Hyunsoonleella jejuensis TaxID=419940 RepID=A0A1H9BCP1_9FLAO|nr:DUF4382 domain-containing protein [Hyunsoonleella jejuensis]SEP86800.1 Carboxypeptidase regulatory-like domain-containing protein [Hyunsoonleella jejuensis]